MQSGKLIENLTDEALLNLLQEHLKESYLAGILQKNGLWTFSINRTNIIGSDYFLTVDNTDNKVVYFVSGFGKEFSQRYCKPEEIADLVKSFLLDYRNDN
jgi:hypothetical protein